MSKFLLFYWITNQQTPVNVQLNSWRKLEGRIMPHQSGCKGLTREFFFLCLALWKMQDICWKSLKSQKQLHMLIKMLICLHISVLIQAQKKKNIYIYCFKSLWKDEDSDRQTDPWSGPGPQVLVWSLKWTCRILWSSSPAGGILKGSESFCFWRFLEKNKRNRWIIILIDLFF